MAHKTCEPRNILLVALILLTLASCRSHQQTAANKRNPLYQMLVMKLSSYVYQKDAHIGIAIIIDGRDTVSVNALGGYPMMSVVKFPEALAVAHWLDTKGNSLDDTVSIGLADLHEDTYSPMVQKYGRKSTTMSYKELMEWSLMESDNNAADILLNQIGGVKGATNLLKEMGVDAGISIVASEADMHRDNHLSYHNSTTPKAMAALFDRFNAEMRHRSASFGEIASMLERCNTGLDRLPAPLAQTDAVIGHKTGTGFTTPEGRLMAVNDCGYVNLPGGHRYAIAVLVANSAYTIEENDSIIADISKMVYDVVKENIRREAEHMRNRM